MVTFCHHSHTSCHTTSVSLSTYCDITMAATVTTILVKEVVNMQITETVASGGQLRALLWKYCTIK